MMGLALHNGVRLSAFQRAYEKKFGGHDETSLEVYVCILRPFSSEKKALESHLTMCICQVQENRHAYLAQLRH